VARPKTSIPTESKASAPAEAGKLSSNRSDAEQDVLNAEMIKRLDGFLDELAVSHHKAMDQVVMWLTGYGDLEREIKFSVEVLNPFMQKWTIEICFLLRMREPRRFHELKEGLPGIGSRTLSQRLKELEAQGYVVRTVFAEVPARVEYRFTPKGSRLGDLFLPIIAHLRISEWRESRGIPAKGS